MTTSVTVDIKDILQSYPDAKREYLIPLPYRRMAVNDDVGMKLAARPQNHVVANHAVGADRAIVTDLRFGVDDRRAVDGSHGALPILQHKRHFRFTDRFPVHPAHAFGLADFAPGLGQFHVNDQHMAGQHGLPPFDILGGHEVGDLA